MAKSLKEQVVAGAFWNGIERFGTAFFLFVSNLVLARLLSPDDFGCIGMLMVFISISEAIADGGFGAALVQKEQVSRLDYSTIFIWNILVSIFLYVVLFFCAPLIAAFYNIDSLAFILRVQGIILLFNGLCIVQRSMLQKNLMFKKLAKVNVTATIGGTVLGIFCAFIGWGIWSLVVKFLFTALMTTVILWIGSKWKPVIRFSKDSFRNLFSFGGFMFLTSITNSIYQNVISLVIGKSLSSATLGYFTQARKLEDVPRQTISSIITNVTFPAFSQLQNDKGRVFTALRNTVALLGFVNISFSVLLMIVAKPLVVLLLSEKWIQCVPYFQVICLYGVGMGFIDLYQSVFKGLGKSNYLFYTGLLRKSIGVILILLGAQWGMKGILFGYVVGQFIGIVIVSIPIKRIINYGLLRQASDIMKSALPSLFAGLATFITYQYFEIHNNLISVLAQGSCFLALLIVVSVIFRVQGGMIIKDLISGKSEFSLIKKSKNKII